jgi:hypothetical protein
MPRHGTTEAHEASERFRIPFTVVHTARNVQDASPNLEHSQTQRNLYCKRQTTECVTHGSKHIMPALPKETYTGVYTKLIARPLLVWRRTDA